MGEQGGSPIGSILVYCALGNRIKRYVLIYRSIKHFTSPPGSPVHTCFFIESPVF